jgi:CelD/BcsL family acetyltransferase involved in cellulose biosynthesis
VPASSTAANHIKLAVRCVRSDTDFHALRSAWTGLWDVSPTASPTLRFEWLWEWWQHYGEVCAHAPEGLLIVVVERGHELVAALPLYVGRRANLPFSPRLLRFLSTGEERAEEICAVYLDMLYRPGEATASAELMASALNDLAGHAWDACELSPLSAVSPLTSWTTTFGSARGSAFASGARGPSYVANLEGGYDAYLARISKNSREQARRLVRSLDAAGVVFELATDADSIQLFYRELVDLHQARWVRAGRPGCFASRRFTEFHRALARQLTPGGGAILARLVHKGRTWSVVQGYVAGGKFDYYLAGTCLDEDAPVKSPGIATHLLLKRHCATAGITRYDYMPGVSRLKVQFSTEEEQLVGLQLDTRYLGALAFEASKGSARAVRRAIRLVHGQFDRLKGLAIGRSS